MACRQSLRLGDRDRREEWQTNWGQSCFKTNMNETQRQAGRQTEKYKMRESKRNRRREREAERRH